MDALPRSRASAERSLKRIAMSSPQSRAVAQGSAKRIATSSRATRRRRNGHLQQHRLLHADAAGVNQHDGCCCAIAARHDCWECPRAQARSYVRRRGVQATCFSARERRLPTLPAAEQSYGA
ncbi:hypothetical protein XCR_4347 [Xanthomonas campestris pv. raphani 756C]|nr:hypothetical protein XCR_4347 [Xanthomonas campestris pv. raphani 756C]